MSICRFFRYSLLCAQLTSPCLFPSSTSNHSLLFHTYPNVQPSVARRFLWRPPPLSTPTPYLSKLRRWPLQHMGYLVSIRYWTAARINSVNAWVTTRSFLHGFLWIQLCDVVLGCLQLRLGIATVETRGTERARFVKK